MFSGQLFVVAVEVQSRRVAIIGVMPMNNSGRRRLPKQVIHQYCLLGLYPKGTTLP
jgi:hypothetical protein